MNKKTLSESDICDKYIRPALERAGWNGMDQIYSQYPLRAGRMVVRGRQARRDETTVVRADYALFHKINIPLGVVEAKDNKHAMGAGMAQAINYGQLLQVPFCFSSNGDGFVFRDATLADGILERNLTLDEFPSPADLWERYCAWKGWTNTVRSVAESEYAPSKTPRYYQLAAINRTVEVIAGGQDRVLLVMATGTGKTYTAFQIIRLGVSASMCREFLNLSNNSNHARWHYATNASGTSSSMKNVSREVALRTPVPLPPLAEQRRIIVRVESLRRLCADLRQRLAAHQNTQAHLAEALIETSST